MFTSIRLITQQVWFPYGETILAK